MNVKILTEASVTSGSGSSLAWANPDNSNVAWKILFGHCVYTSNATAGNRRFKLVVLDASGEVVTDGHAGVVQITGLVREYSLKVGIPKETSFVDDHLDVSLAQGIIVLPGWQVQITDEAAIDAAGDLIVVNLVLETGNLSKMVA